MLLIAENWEKKNKDQFARWPMVLIMKSDKQKAKKKKTVNNNNNVNYKLINCIIIYAQHKWYVYLQWID